MQFFFWLAIFDSPKKKKNDQEKADQEAAEQTNKQTNRNL
jgi:hypothetical protein